VLHQHNTRDNFVLRYPERIQKLVLNDLKNDPLGEIEIEDEAQD